MASPPSEEFGAPDMPMNPTSEPVEQRCHFAIRGSLRGLLAGLGLGLGFGLSTAGPSVLGNPLPFADSFRARGLIEGVSGSGEGNNANATLEPGEPVQADREVGRSLWISWVAPRHGLAEIRTDGSKLDTVLAVFAAESALRGTSPGETPAADFSVLREVAAQDDADEPDALFSRVRFPVRAGLRYEIVVSGYAGAGGEIVLAWNLEETSRPLPVLLHREFDRGVVRGRSERLVFEVVGGGDPVRLQWFRNGVPIPGANAPEIRFPAFGPPDAGHYRLEVETVDPDGGDDDDEDASYSSRNLELQEAPVDLASVLARDKVLGWSESGATGTLGLQAFLPRPGRVSALRRHANHDGQDGVSSLGESMALAVGAGVTRGFTGTQVFDTTPARRDPGEPDHCGLVGGTSYWYRYVAPEAGSVTFDTLGSAFDTILAVYTYEVPVRGYADLVEVACNDDFPGANGRSRVTFGAVAGRPYLVVVDGKNGARGNAWLNWAFALPRPGLEYSRSDRDLILRMTTRPGATYRLVATDALSGSWQTLLEHTAVGTQWTWTNDVMSGPARFFRVNTP